jgi:NAD(P)H-nitrite reductase large subunit
MASHHPGAILQMDRKTYAIVTRIPAGIVTPEDLERIATVARTHRIPLMKITSGQRIALAGIHEKDIEPVWKDLQESADQENAPCVRYVQACLGTETCKYGVQDSIGVALEIERRYHGVSFPAKLKIGVSGCLRCCSESYLRDIGLVGTNRGWTVVFGGNSGRRPSIGTKVAEDLLQNDALDLVRRLLEYYQDHAEPQERTGRFLERIGYGRLRSELLNMLPYVPLEDVQ